MERIREVLQVLRRSIDSQSTIAHQLIILRSQKWSQFDIKILSRWRYKFTDTNVDFTIFDTDFGVHYFVSISRYMALSRGLESCEIDSQQND